MEAIVNVCENWGIGMDNRLLVTLPSDLRRFRALTEGKTVILGRKTLATFPGGKPLKNRNNLILSENPDYFVEDAEVVRSLLALLARVRELPEKAVCVIGGAQIYRLLLPYCSRAFVTRTFLSPPADRFFPALDTLPEWEKTAQSEPLTENGVTFQFEDYVNLSPRPLP